MADGDQGGWAEDGRHRAALFDGDSGFPGRYPHLPGDGPAGAAADEAEPGADSCLFGRAHPAGLFL